MRQKLETDGSFLRIIIVMTSAIIMKFITHMEDAMEGISNKSLSYEAINVILPDIFLGINCVWDKRGLRVFYKLDSYAISTIKKLPLM